jgi:hypothetical protein
MEEHKVQMCLEMVTREKFGSKRHEVIRSSDIIGKAYMARKSAMYKAAFGWMTIQKHHSLIVIIFPVALKRDGFFLCTNIPILLPYWPRRGTNPDSPPWYLEI